MCRRKQEDPTPAQREEMADLFRAIDTDGYGLVSKQQIRDYDREHGDADGIVDKSKDTKGGRDDGADVKLLDPTDGGAAPGSAGGASGDGDGAERTMDLDAFITHRWSTRKRRPSIFLVHGALVLVQVIFGIGSVVGKLGVSKFNPVLFALIREAAAGPLLVVMALFLEGWLIKICHPTSWRFAAGGLFLFANQLCFIVGEKLSSAVIGSAWQPSQAIFTVILTLILCMEKPTVLKIGGVLVACGGAVFMVVWGADVGTSDVNDIAGNVLFAINCLGTSLYVIIIKPLLKKYPPLSVTGFCYICASVFMAIAAVGINLSPDVMQLICPPPANLTDPAVANTTLYACGTDSLLNCTCSPWGVPLDAVLPLLYWIVFNSAVAYFLMTWGNKFADASKVLAYSALQPLTSALLSVVLLLLVPSMNGSLSMPGINSLGGIGIVLGLVCIIWDDSIQKKKRQQEAARRVADEAADAGFAE